MGLEPVRLFVRPIDLQVTIPHGGLRTQILSEEEVFALYNESPSHTVGLEHARRGFHFGGFNQEVTIPHGGLRTPASHGILCDFSN